MSIRWLWTKVAGIEPYRRGSALGLGSVCGVCNAICMVERHMWNQLACIDLMKDETLRISEARIYLDCRVCLKSQLHPATSTSTSVQEAVRNLSNVQVRWFSTYCSMPVRLYSRNNGPTLMDSCSSSRIYLFTHQNDLQRKARLTELAWEALWLSDLNIERHGFDSEQSSGHGW